MENIPAYPPNTIESLQTRCLTLEQQVAELDAKLKWYEEQFRLSQQKKFGSSSERTNPDQLQLFNEAEVEAQPIQEQSDTETVTYQRKKQRGQREAQIEHLPIETIEYDLPASEQVCPCCNGSLHVMSKEVRQELKIIPATVTRVEHVRFVYSCRQCERQGIQTPIVTAPMPKPVQSASFASPSLVAYIMSQKYLDAMPLHRQEQQFTRLGVALSRQTMANWMIHGATQWLQPLYDRMHTHLLQSEVLHADETPLQVLKEPGRSAETTSYMWLYRTGREGPPIILYDYQKTRGGEHPRQFLSGFHGGYLHVDGYPGYHKVAETKLVGCWAHARRKFDEALKALPDGKQLISVTAREGLEFCNQLFSIERDLKEATPEERFRVRIERSRPIVDAFLTWLRYQRPRVLPKSVLGKAIAYCLHQWDKLEVFLEDGRLEIDNNRSERSIKPFVIGRKNWLFSNTQRGAKASATIYSIIETAKENGLNPFQYLTWLFEELPQLPDLKDPTTMDSLLPWSSSIPVHCKMDR